MASFKLRNNMFFPTSLKVGNDGSTINKILTGTVSACILATNASAFTATSAYIAGMDAGDTLLMQPAGSGMGSGSVFLIGCSAVSANTACMYMANYSGTNATASTGVFTYVVIGI